MQRMLRDRPSPSMVVAMMALFVSLGGVSYGVATNSINSRELKDNTVRSRDLRNNDVRGNDLRAGTVTGSDLTNDGVTGTDILESSLATVPRATTADRATSAGDADNAPDRWSPRRAVTRVDQCRQGVGPLCVRRRRGSGTDLLRGAA